MKIVAKNITIKRAGFELRNISFSLNDKENLVITGASGSGKTTLAKALSGQLFVAGDLKIDYSSDTDLPAKAVYVEQRYTIKNRSNTVDGYYQQRYNSADNEDSYTVSEELKFVSDDEKRIDFLLNELSCEYLKNKPLLQLSSGEHKKFQLIKALLKPAQLLILDDPFTGLDAASREKLNRILAGVSAGGTTLIIIAGAHHPIPDCITKVLELKGGQQNFFACISSLRGGTTKQSGNISTMDCFASLAMTRQYNHLPLQKSEPDFKDAILMKNVTVEYGGKIILDNINWQVKKGERWLLKGKNGAGKSTLMSLIVADNPQAYSNEIYLFDKRRGSGESIWDIKKNIGFVSPELCAYFDRSVSCFDTVASGYFDTVGVYKKLTDDRIQHINDWLKALDVTSLARKRLSEVSSGAQRLFLLIRSLIKNPPLLILDEPCQGLDEFQTKSFIRLVDDICAQSDTTIVYVSHYEDEVPACISRVLELITS
jgi:molybdate transport system ATP-binding protein